MTQVNQMDKQRRLQCAKDELKRRQYKLMIQNQSLPPETRAQAVVLLNKLSRQGSLVRVRNRCVLTGRSRGILRKWRLSRIQFRELTAQGRLLGVSKLSW